MKRMMTALLLTILVTGSAQALNTRELVAIAAMPLAVAAVADVNGVPANDLVTVVSAMNRAYVPAPQFVEIVRYTPVALVDDTMNPPFVTYVTTQADRGIYGDAYALSLADRLQLYGVDEINVRQPVMITPTYVVQRDYIPSYVVTRIQQPALDPLALIAMPLAVAAVSNLAGIPQSDLFGLISSLNRAYVPAPQFVEIVRYSPMLLVDRDPTFVRFVSGEVDRGIVGTRLVRVIDDRFGTYGVREINLVNVSPGRVIIRREEYVPRVVVNRVAEFRAHPHGGPPGILKRDLGVQTGAEVVHGQRPGHVKGDRATATARPRSPKPGKAHAAHAGTRKELIVLPNAKPPHGKAKAKSQTRGHAPKPKRQSAAVSSYSGGAASAHGRTAVSSSHATHGSAKSGAGHGASKASKGKGKRNH